MDKTSLKLVFLVACLVINPTAALLKTDIILNMHGSTTIADICNPAEAGRFQEILINFAFSDLTINGNIDFVNYKAFMIGQMQAFTTAQTLFEKETKDLEKTVEDFLIVWLTWYAYKHIDYFMSIYGGQLPELPALLTADKAKDNALSDLPLEISAATMQNLFFHLKTNAESATVKTKIAAIKTTLQKHYVDLARKIVGTPNFSHEKKELAYKYLEEGVTFFDREAVYGAFLRLGIAGKSVVPDKFFSDGYIFSVLETDQPIFELVTFEAYFLINDGLFVDEKIISSLSSISALKYSPAFIKWLNEENLDQIDFKPKAYIWYLYLHHAINAGFADDATSAQVAEVLITFLLKKDNCYKDNKPKLPECMVTQILDRAKYSKHWVAMYLLLAKLVPTHTPTSDKNAIIALPIWQIQTNLKHVTDDTIRGYIATAITSNKVYEAIGDIRAKANGLEKAAILKITETDFKKRQAAFRNLKNTIKTQLYDVETVKKIVGVFDSTTNGDELAEFLAKVYAEEEDEIVKFGLLNILIGYINEKLALREEEKKLQEAQRKLKDAEVKKIEKVIIKFQTLIVEQFDQDVPDEAAQGIISYMRTTLLYFGAAKPFYYFSDLANLFRGFDQALFCLANLKDANRKNFAESMVNHELTNSATAPFAYFTSDAFIINYLHTFEVFTEYLEFFDYFVVIQPGLEKEVHQKMFLSTYNILYRFLATHRYHKLIGMTDSLEGVWNHLMECVAIRYNQPVPTNSASRDEICPLSYSETVELAHVYLGFLLTSDKNTYLPLYKKALTKELANPMVRLSHFYRIVFLQDRLRDTFENLCRGANYDDLPVCLGFNFILNTNTILTYETFKVDHAELSTSFHNYIKTAISTELTYLSKEGKDKIAQRSIVWSAIATLYEMDHKSGKFAILVDEGRLNGMAGKKAKINTVTGQTVMTSDQKLYKVYLETISYMPSTEKAADSIADATAYLRLRFRRSTGTSADQEIQKHIVDNFKKDAPFFVVEGDLVPHLAEFFAKVATTDEHFKVLATYLYQSGKFLVVTQWSEFQQNPFEAGIYVAIKAGVDAQTAVQGSLTSYILTAIGKGERHVIQNSNPQSDFNGDSKFDQRMQQLEKGADHVNGFKDSKIDDALEKVIEDNLSVQLTKGKTVDKFQQNIQQIVTNDVKRTSIVEEVIEQKFLQLVKDKGETVIPEERQSETNSDTFNKQLNIVTVQVTFDEGMMELLGSGDSFTIQEVNDTPLDQAPGTHALSEQTIETTLNQMQTILASKGVDITDEEINEYREYLKTIRYRRAII